MSDFGITIVIPFFNGHPHIRRLVESVPAELPVIIVDDVSDEPLSLPEFKNVTIGRLKEKGYFSGAVNAGMALSLSKYPENDILVLNQDSFFKGDAALRMLAEKRDQFAMIGERMAGDHPAWPAGYVHGTFMFLRQDAIQAVGPLNVRHYPLWGSTAEWQARAARAGFRILPIKQGSIPQWTHVRKGNFGDSIRTLLEREPELKPLLIRTPPAVSVIIPNYNYGRYLPDAIASLVGGESCLGPQPGQDFGSFEVIIVDDSSTDESRRIIEGLVDPWKGVRAVFREQNGGTSAANNSGAREAVGQFLTILCADDMMEPDRLGLMHQVSVDHPHTLVYDDIQIFKDGRRLKKAWGMSDYDFERLLFKNHIHAGIMIERKAWAEVGGWPEAMRYGREDWAMNIRLGIHGYCGVHVKNPGYLYRRERQNRSLRNEGPVWRNRFLGQLRALYPEIYKGERPMGCCPGSRIKTRPSKNGGSPMANQKPLAGRDGMVMLEFLLPGDGTSTWYGPATGKPYLFGGDQRFRFVDAADAPGMVGMYDKGRDIFAYAKEESPELDISPAEAAVINPPREPAPEEPAAEDQPIDMEPLEILQGEEAGAPDDLSQIKGVGPASVNKLQEAGIMTFSALAMADPEQVAKLVPGGLAKAQAVIQAANELLEPA